ncbi:MAG: PEGA domain-containing protein [Bdellovibrionales bacterium]|nr:PEGA domain-containing protein [Bdellovibrionales bacterium]
MKSLILLFSYIATVEAFASARAQWIASVPKSDAQYKYYVGRATEEMSEKEAWRTAKDQAQETAVRENFGVETSIASSSHESFNQVALDKRVQEIFPRVRLVDFEQIDSFVESDSGRVSVWILFRYPLHQIALENERQKRSGAAEPIHFNEVGQPEMNYSTILELTSEPLGIPVFIDSERWGVTPLRVAGVLSAGVHKIHLTHENYQDVETDTILILGSITKVHHKLLPAMGTLRINVSPRWAEVVVDGISHRNSSTQPIQVLVGKPARIEARLKGFETQIQLIEVQKDELRWVHFELNPTKRNLITEDLSHTTSILLPNSFDSVSEPAGFQKAWLAGVLFGYSSESAPAQYGLPTAQFGLTLEKRFLWHFGLRGGITYDVATEYTETSDMTDHYAIEGSGSFIGLPIYFTNSSAGIYIMPELGQIRHKRVVELPNPYLYLAEIQFMEMKANRKGIRFGYLNMDSEYDFWISFHQYDWREYGKVQATAIGITCTWNDGGK